MAVYVMYLMIPEMSTVSCSGLKRRNEIYGILKHQNNTIGVINKDLG